MAAVCVVQNVSFWTTPGTVCVLIREQPFQIPSDMNEGLSLLGFEPMWSFADADAHFIAGVPRS